MKETKKQAIINGIYLFSIIVCICTIGYMGFIIMFMFDECEFDPFYVPLNDTLLVPDDEASNISVCANMSANAASRCLNNIFKEIFVYNLTLDYEYENFSIVDQYIRQYGGDCHESAEWFNRAGSELGYHTKYVDFTVDYNNDTDPIVRYLHAVAIIADNEGYCIMDQGQLIHCHEFMQANYTELEELSKKQQEAYVVDWS